MLRSSVTFLIVVFLFGLLSCSHRFEIEKPSFNFRLCRLDDAVKYEKFIGSELIEDSAFYNTFSGYGGENVVYARKESGCGLPLYVMYETWMKSESKHLFSIKYFWGPYHGLAYDSVYVKKEMKEYFLEHPYSFNRLKREYSSFATQLSQKIGYKLSEDEILMIDESGTVAGWMNQWDHAYDSIIEFQTGPEFDLPIWDVCLFDRKGYGTIRDADLDRCSDSFSIVPGMYPFNYGIYLEDSDKVKYAYMRLTIHPGASRKELSPDFYNDSK